ncbi:MaoC family dehydratase [Scleromatobacter humisilvae]|uniref:MaoC family dehydratase n=1 Tax=Scleromatobacter humisilvae TaxID=2897159 RepID=A0A9X1YLZ9_9BURK|nr:MaoC family dehydratase [Scleromatobacter humisilvae]MCK9684141.1 MaoC family dehydratase [Scleromatobacter humisilvae]
MNAYLLADLAALEGREIGRSDWVVVEQSNIDQFAQATRDEQWIHVDPARAAAGPFGTTVAHGFLTLSLVSHLFSDAVAFEDVRLSINYGLNRVRFPSPVPVGSRLRALCVLDAFEAIAGGAQLTVTITLEREGSAKPACVAEWVTRHFT